jgi:hypothetical protein
MRQSRIPAAGAVTAAMFLASLTVATGCASIDPTDLSHFTDVLVRNDTASAVQLIQCGSTCATLHDREQLPAGASTTIRASHEGFTVGYLIEQPSGAKLGCLYMRFSHTTTTAVVNVSSLTTCR